MELSRRSIYPSAIAWLRRRLNEPEGRGIGTPQFTQQQKGCGFLLLNPVSQGRLYWSESAPRMVSVIGEISDPMIERLPLTIITVADIPGVIGVVLRSLASS